ncbi:class I SAM-dependent methyltransferase [Iningainema sp. BLCCT55]|uniref:Class I SAM-dependent methyltransferase n=2 Tax=Iningainema TaxID=1932705 RepID=A0A8J7C6C5_9CYAN|nr:class I SAM-dependent methyltransferase [Iningainema tapete BLCC-T55]
MNYKQQLLADFNSRTNYDSGRFYAPVANRLIEFANMQTGQQVLDVATGTGIVALSAAQIVGASGKVIGVDISAGMLSYAKQKLAATGLENVEFIEADAEHLKFSDNSFDRILCSLAICYLTDIPAALQQWYRFLKPGAMVAFNAWAETAFPPSVLFRQVAQRYGIEIPNPNEPLGTLERCYQLLQQIGFKDIEVQSEQFGWYFTPDTKTAEDIWNINSQNVFGSQVFQLSADKLQQCKTEYIAEIQALPITEKGAWCDAKIFFVRARL